MPLKSSTLYRNGVGSFERSLAATPGETLEVPLGPGQLSDATKTIAVRGTRAFSAVTYDSPSTKDIERARICASDDEEKEVKGDLPEGINQLRGEMVDVFLSKGTKVTGRVLEVNRGQVESS